MDEHNDVVYLTVKLVLKSGQTQRTIREIVWDLDYSFVHNEIIGHVITEILDSPEQTS